ncbi:MAG: hypothetical protein KIY12_01920 [Thermoplasmata archaeon]|uniref:Polymerase nucleotidyl transferase domain-containing protein n=1 Tax=Candidatus Sysuiplasma superficiale TaxID=2823368 RepID=A0A8J7YKC2_9ARCH|nr:hypothetical protein [Candidatus Sysuiplasma superficiale]MBX8643475.1 hypothetical protein [Candidatus Sysuiplasma superficiale]
MRSQVISELRYSSFCGYSASIDDIQNRLCGADRELIQHCSNAITSLLNEGAIKFDGKALSLSADGSTARNYLDDRRRAEERYRFASQFLNDALADIPDVLLAGIGGSVSYGTAREDDDVDIVIVSRDGALWNVLWRLLLDARKTRKGSPDKPLLCFSYCIEDSAFRVETATHRSRLFASDFLNMKVVKGEGYYAEILRENEWMASYYPGYYRRARTGSKGGPAPSAMKTRPDVTKYAVAGTYLKLSATVRNILFRLRGMNDSDFSAIIRHDRCIYQSSKWKRLEMLDSHK